jgi:formate dehydrogenase maturation protein FdhE
MIWGDQWLCGCGWHNLFVRVRCRNCGEPKLPDEKIVSLDEALATLPTAEALRLSREGK